MRMRALPAMKEEIESKHWKTLFERLNDFERGQLVTVQLVEHDGSQRELGRSLTLESISFEPTTSCVDGVRIRASDGFTHTALEPLHILLVKNPTGGFNPVEIDAEEGSVILQFKPALKPAIVDGLTRTAPAPVRNG
jgi:hypothetical protein